MGLKEVFRNKTVYNYFIYYFRDLLPILSKGLPHISPSPRIVAHFREKTTQAAPPQAPPTALPQQPI